MDISIHYAFLPHTDTEATVAFYRDILGFAITQDVGYEGMRWITLTHPSQPGTSLVLEPPAVDPTLTDEERRVVLELAAKGSFGHLTLATPTLQEAFDAVEASGVDIIQEPMDQPYGVRDCAFRDPSGNLIRMNQAA